MTTSDGSTADYYELPAGATQLQDLISHRDMNAQLGEIFRAAYRYGMASHSGKLRDAKKIKFYIDAEIKRLDVLLARAKVDGCCETIDPADVEIASASAIDDDSERMRAIGQNGEMADEVYAAVDGWIEWYGGKCPLLPGVLVDTRHRDGEERIGSVCDDYGTRTAPMFWTNTGDKAEITAYRLHTN